jgi:hypothetical protein
MNLTRLAPQPQALECADLSALSAGDLSLSNAGKASGCFHAPLNAALLWRQVAKAVKAVTSHRTPNLCHSCANCRHCIKKSGTTMARRDFYSCPLVLIRDFD